MRKRAAFIGLTGIDYVYYLDAFPDENSKCKTNEYAKYVGGPAANAAITYAALGGDATLITAYGNSAESKTITEELRRYGVKVINTSEDDKLPGISTICISKDGKRTIISGQNQYDKIDLNSIEMDSYDFALFDCNQQDISLPLLEKVNCEIVLDAGNYKTNVEKYLEKAKVVISSEQFRDERGQDIFQMPYSNIVCRAMTRGEGAILCARMSNEEQGAVKLTEIPVKQVTCADSLAAGDIFHGAFCYAYYEKELTFKEALYYAADIASESVQYKGPRGWIDKTRRE